MRSNLSRSLVVLALVVLFPAMLAAASTPDADLRSGISADAPSKVCHPKKPITCRADAFPLSTDVTVELSTDGALKQAGLCFGPRLLCGAEAFNPSELLLEVIEKETPENQAGLCFGPRLLCGAGMDALDASDLWMEELEEPSQQAGLCFGPRLLCKAQNLS
jgi:hypothetical protein